MKKKKLWLVYVEFGGDMECYECFFPLFSFLPLWLHYNLNPLCVQY